MVFSSAPFIFIFLPLVFAAYALMPGLRAKNAMLTIASLFFYAYGEPLFVLVMLGSIVLNYILARMIAGADINAPAFHVSENKAASAGEAGSADKTAKSAGRMHTSAQRALLAVAVVCNLLLIGVFKYAGFFVQTINDVTGLSLRVPQIALPIGISFFTFQALSYVIDVYRDPSTVQKSLGKVMLYISFFPQLIAGPIVKYHDIAPYLESRTQNIDEITIGIHRFVTGLAKKMFLANSMGAVADMMFGLPEADMSAGTAWIGAVCYTMQIFFDFSGYSDMAIGIGHMFGFTIKENFDHPYISTSIKDFWRRWHISLSTWFKEYLYIPMGGSRVGLARTEINKLIVFFATGLWHGASWNFVIWGMIHVIAIVVEDLVGRILPGEGGSGLWNDAVTAGSGKIGTSAGLGKVGASSGLGKARRFSLSKAVGWLYTILIVIFAFVLFRADTLTDGLLMYKEMLTGFGSAVEDPSAAYNTCMEALNAYNITLFAAACFFCAPHPKLNEKLCEHGVGAYIVTAVLFILCVLEIAGASFNPFIYFRF